LGRGGSCDKAGRGDEKGAKKSRSNAIRAHENDIPDMCDKGAYFGKMCSKFAAPPQHELFQQLQTHSCKIGSGRGQESVTGEG
jgi:hypothetical protein